MKRLINDMSHEKTWTWIIKENFKRETVYLLMTAQNNAIRTSHIKARLDKTQQNSKCKLCVDTDQTINHIINKCRKWAHMVYKTRHDCVGKVIPWKMCKKFKFDNTNKWYMHNLVAVLANDTQTPMGLWHTNGSPNLDQTTRPYNKQQQKKENLQNCRLCSTGWPQNKTERKWKERKVPRACQGIKKNYGT